MAVLSVPRGYPPALSAGEGIALPKLTKGIFGNLLYEYYYKTRPTCISVSHPPPLP
jgi:hypothetical protein